MTAALTTLTLLLCSQAPETFSMRFDGFTSSEQMPADQLNKLMHAAFEKASEDPKLHFVLVDQREADVVVTAVQRLVGPELHFQYFLTTTRCPVRTTDVLQKLPRKAVNREAAEGMAREVAKRADKLLHEQLGDEALACAEPGQSLGGTVTIPEGAPNSLPPPSGGPVGGVFMPNPARPGVSPKPAGRGPAPASPAPAAGAASPSTGVSATSRPSQGQATAFPGAAMHGAAPSNVQATPAPGSTSGTGTTPITTTTTLRRGATVHMAPAHVK